jgi:drug/metabolite transporter (DMT)-like permease
MILSKSNPSRNKVIWLLVVSIICYSISNILSYFVAVNLSPAAAIVTSRVGALLFLVALLYLERGKISSLFKLRIDKRAWIYGIAFGINGVLLFTAYQTYTLSSIFPMVEGGSLVFLALDFLINRKEIRRSQIMPLVLGVFVVFIGTYLSQSTGFTFNVAALPYVIGIIVCSGVGYYAMVYKTEHDDTESKLFTYIAIGALLGAMLIPIQPIKAIPTSYLVEMLCVGIIGGFLLCVAFVTEIRAVVQGLKNNKSNDVGVRNFINNAEGLDTAVVVIASIWVGSFTYESVLGGLLIVVGVIILSFVT